MRAQSDFTHPCSMEKGCHYFRGNKFLHLRFLQLFVIFTSFTFMLVEGTTMSSLCRRRCGDLAIEYPFGIDDGCGSLEYRSLLVCTNDSDTQLLQLWTPSGRYRVMNISYDDQYLVVSDPSMWSCGAGDKLPHSQRFSLDISKKFSISVTNTFLYFNCNESFVLVRPQPSYCESQSERCESVCDSNNYLCNNLPICPKALTSKTSCCSYYPRTSDSLRLMLENCESYTSVYWGLVKGNKSTTYNQIPSYGIRLNYEVPISSQCVSCEEHGGICGYGTQFSSFLCLCSHKNTTTYCSEHGNHGRKGQVAAGIVGGVGVGGMIGGGAIIWYRRRRRRRRSPNRPQRLGALNNNAS